ncbi:somatostatin 1, tandem duplicate 1 [Antennarius striatus]|uniref:somatostatin 1, tandem duplicate 1 n=1 Tax=Antennarius striatus TaxID=241820 RepID=UPI0035B1876C
MKMMKMLSSPRARCLLLFLLLSLSASISCSDPQRDAKVRLWLHRYPLLGSKQAGLRDAPRAALADLLLSDLLQEENEALEEEENFRLDEGEPEDVRTELARAAGTGPLLAPRERKAGCKNFFWKTFTSC